MTTKKLKAHEKSKIYRYKTVDGEKIKPVFYAGKVVGHGNYMSGVLVESGEMIRDSKGRPIPYKEIVSS